MDPLEELIDKLVVCKECGLAEYYSTMGFRPEDTYYCSLTGIVLSDPESSGCTFGYWGEPQFKARDIELLVGESLHYALDDIW